MFLDTSGLGFGNQKRNLDEIDRSNFGTFAKRNLDEIDRSDFGRFVKKRETIDGESSQQRWAFHEEENDLFLFRIPVGKELALT